jgi:CubicO group peptidase (beta-lactamase class C family)
MHLSLRVWHPCAGALFAALLAVSSALAAPPPLAELEGHYEYREGATLYLVGDGDRLVAILGDGKYPLRATGADTFVNGVGDAIPFVRDAAGRIVAFKEKGDTFKRLSSDVPDTVRSILRPRPLSSDGKPPAYRYAPPADHGDGIRVGPLGPGMLPRHAAQRLVTGVIDGTYPDVRSILIYQAGALRLEEYFYGYDVGRPHQMRSFTKSVIALVAGAAVDRGKLRADEPVLARLGYAAYANPDPRKDRITLLDLLSNRSGLACNDHDSASPGRETNLYDTNDWVKTFVDLPVVADPGTAAFYCTGGFFAAGRAIERAVGKPLPEFAEEVLFGPLGMRKAERKWDFTVDRSRSNEFGQLHLRPRDMLKLGLLIQQRGEWAGRRVLSASWIEAAVARQTRVDDSDYGLGIWHRWYPVTTATGQSRVDTVMLSGNGGQKVYLVPSLDLIAVFTGGSFNANSPVNAMMSKVLLPALLEGRPSSPSSEP